ncbi:ATP-binding protein [Pseudomonas sp. PGPR40]|uniref:ATP-binding protein n=1 Tax=Pseudomonas sp. PGPR40 TaxID=2913476 RepID=UPI001EDA7F6E|nr:ATP-binding protein [Pseudomonas sp. PGPR40]
MTALDTSIIRPKAIEEHPLCSQNYLVPTDSISLVWEYLDKTLRRRSGGFVMWGHWRIGKSSAIRYLQKVAQAKYKGLFTATLEGETKLYISERDFFADLCKELGVSTNGSSGECKRRAVDRMILMGERNAKRLFLLFIDEPQKWTDLQLNWLCEIYDKLERHNVRLISVMVGQSTLVAFRQNYIDRGNGILTDRLMREAIEFHGVRDPEELKVVLGGYDTIIESDLAWPFTRFFFPQAYLAGFRLQEATEIIWNAFVEAIDANGKLLEHWIPMKHLTILVETLFQEYCFRDAPDFTIDKELIGFLLAEGDFSLYLATLSSPSRHDYGR